MPWLLRMRAESRRNHPFLIWAPFDAPARIWNYGEFHERVGALAAGLKARGVRPGESSTQIGALASSASLSGASLAPKSTVWAVIFATASSWNGRS